MLCWGVGGFDTARGEAILVKLVRLWVGEGKGQ